MKRIIFIAMLFSLVGCKSAQVQNVVQKAECQAESTVASNVSNALVTSLACSNPAQVQSDVLALVSKQKVCNASVPKPKAGKKASSIGALVCPALAGSVSSFVQGKIPASWGCTGGTALTNLTAQLSSACQKNL
jgi:hypothetical protein